MRRLFSLPKGRWVILAVLVMAVTPGFAHAQDANPILSIMAELLFTWLQAVAWLVSKLIDILILFCQVNSFYNHPIVLTGWNLVIQIANMMFLVALLVIAAGTVLNIQNYRYSRLLGNVILMALLVNFSRLIAGFFIQFSQIVMLTFVNSFKDALYGNFAHMFGLDTVFQLATQTGVGQGTSNIVVSMIVSMMFLVMAGATIAAFIAIIVFRIVTLWVLLIISPMAYALAILPQSKKYADQWWSQFVDQLTRGPVIAFYLWLALAIVSQYPVDHPAQGWFPDMATQVAEREQSSAIQFANTYLSFENIVSFIVAMTFLLLGLQQATSASGAAGKWAGSINKSVGGALGFIGGANLVRDFVTRPVQGYWKNRQTRNDAAVGERTAGLDAGMAKLGSMTTGQMKRPLAGAGAVVGGLGKGVLDRVRGKSTLSAGQIIDQAGEAGVASLKLGTRSLQQQQLRVKQADEAQAARRSKEEDLTKLTPELLLARASTTSGESSLLYLNALAKGEKPVGRDAELLSVYKRAGDINSPNAKKLIETVRERDPKMAAQAFYDGIIDTTGKFTEKFVKALKADLSLTGLISPAQLERIAQKNDGSFANMLLSASRNEKDLKTAVDSIDENYRGEVTKHIDLTGKDIETRKMVGRVTGHWHQVARDTTATGGTVYNAAFAPELQRYVKENKKKFKESLSVAASGDADFLHQLIQGKQLNEKDIKEIAERSDFHKQALVTAFTGLDEDGDQVNTAGQKIKTAGGTAFEHIRQKAINQANKKVTAKRGDTGFAAQELSRRLSFMLTGGRVLAHDIGPGADPEMIKNFTQMAKSLKAGEVKKLSKNSDMSNPVIASAVRNILGMTMNKKEIGELSTLGAEEYALASDIVKEVMSHPNAATYLTYDDKTIKKIADKKLRALAYRVRALDTDELTGDLG